MKFNEKIYVLRKERNMTQEALAFEVGVSRQSVSKWETGEFEPNLSTLKRLAEIFDVSVDYLLNDDQESHALAMPTPVKTVRLEESKKFLALEKKLSVWIAIATCLCILSPVCLIFLGAMSEIPKYGISENVAGGAGMIVLLFFIAVAVAIFIYVDNLLSPFAYLEKEIFQTESEVKKYVTTGRENFKRTYATYNILGSCLCILSLLPLFLGVIIDEKNDLFLCCMLICMFVIVSIGVFFFVYGGVMWGSFEKLLQTGEYSKQRKEKAALRTAVNIAYWLVVTAIFLCVAIPTKAWKYSGVVWVIAGVLYPAFISVFNALQKKK